MQSVALYTTSFLFSFLCFRLVDVAVVMKRMSGDGIGKYHIQWDFKTLWSILREIVTRDSDFQVV